MYATSYVHRKAVTLLNILAMIAVGEEVQIRISDQDGLLITPFFLTVLPQYRRRIDATRNQHFQINYTSNVMIMNNSRIGGHRLLRLVTAH